jgi:enoyl-CoA hydratase
LTDPRSGGSRPSDPASEAPVPRDPARPPPVGVARSGGVVTVTIDRPEARNAVDGPTLEALVAAFSELRDDRSVRAVILTGAGERAFVAGADIKAMKDLDEAGARDFAARGRRLGELIEALPVPVIAAVNGFALGGGCELALACDFIYAARGAKLGLPEVGLGVIPGIGGTQRLVRRVGPARARELIFTGALIDADEALRIGLVNAVVEPAALLERTRAVAESIAAKAPLAVAAAKRALREGADLPLADGLALEGALFAQLFATHDQKEGMSAFVDKRLPSWLGR